MDTTIDLEIQHMRTIFNEAYKSELISADDTPRQYEQLNEHNPRHVITASEYKSILKNCDPDFRDLLICAWESGMRQGEIINLVPAQIKLNLQHISGAVMDYIDLSIKDSKTKQRRYVPVSPVLKQVLIRRMAELDPEDYIFTRNGWPQNRTSIGRKLSEACKEAKVPYGDKITDVKGNKVGCVFHGFRYAWISRKIDEGWNDELIRLASGHNSLSSFRRYVRLEPLSVMKLVKKDKVLQNYNKNRVNTL